jgi:hypothetical protein
MDMQTPCFNSIAADRYLAAKDRADEMHASRWQRLYSELMQGWFKSASAVVSCPDSHQTQQSVQEVVSDYLDGTAPQRENDRAEVLSIIAAAALGQNVSDRARALMDRVASAHADWHAETVGDE